MSQLALVRSHSRPGTALNYALLLNRLEMLVTQGRDLDKAEGYLRREAVWKALPEEQALAWSRLAQAAGLLDLTLDILAWLNRTRPGYDPAWKARLELLETLGRREEAAQVRALSPDGQAHVETMGRSDRGSVPLSNGPTDTLSDGLTGPFVQRRREDQAIRRFMDYFRGREDCFARQWTDREAGTQGYVPVRRPIEIADIQEHVQGRKTYGIYLIQEDNRVTLAVIDADVHQRLRSQKLTPADKDVFRREQGYLLTRLPELGRELGWPCLVEYSGGKGYHFWYFFAEPVPAALARKALGRLVQRIAPDLSCFNLEVFPKQDRLAGKGLGNLVKLPLGVHRVTGRQSYFPRVKDRSWPAQAAVLETMVRIETNALEQAAGMAVCETPVLVHPRQETWAKNYPELALLAERCAALGQIMASCRGSRTLSVREEKIIMGSIGFLPRAKTLIHHLFQDLPEYNPHLTDYKLSRVRGTPLGCKRIHGLLNMTLDMCLFEDVPSYPHPLLHLPDWQEGRDRTKAERIVNLQASLDNLKSAMEQVKRFL